MTMRRTPYLKLRYPWTDDVVSVGDVQSMAQDVDQALVQTATMGANFSRFASVAVGRAVAQSIVKATVTAITFDTVVLNNGVNSPLANGAWFNIAAPTRLTAPTACVVVACGSLNIVAGTALGVNGAVQVMVALNGATTQPGVQGTKWGPISTATGSQYVSCISMWKLVAGDFLELKTFWTGTPAGPFNTGAAGVGFGSPLLSLMMVALPTVP